MTDDLYWDKYPREARENFPQITTSEFYVFCFGEILVGSIYVRVILKFH